MSAEESCPDAGQFHLFPPLAPPFIDCEPIRPIAPSPHVNKSLCLRSLCAWDQRRHNQATQTTHPSPAVHLHPSSPIQQTQTSVSFDHKASSRLLPTVRLRGWLFYFTVQHSAVTLAVPTSKVDLPLHTRHLSPESIATPSEQLNTTSVTPELATAGTFLVSSCHNGQYSSQRVTVRRPGHLPPSPPLLHSTSLRSLRRLHP